MTILPDPTPPAEETPEVAPVEPTTTTDLTVEPTDPTDAPLESDPVEPSDTDPTVAPTTDVTPAASETPDPADSTPADPTPILLPQDGNWSTQQIAAAQQLGIETPQGRPLDPAAREILRGIETALVGIESWLAHARKTLSNLPPS